LGAKFAAGVFDTGGNFATVSLTLVANLPPVSVIPVVHFDVRFLREFSKKFETFLLGYSWAGGN
jgi:hypothetical protein